MNIKFIPKLLISIIVFSFIAAIAPADALAGNAKDHHRQQSHKIVFSKLIVKPNNSQLLNQPLHFCPVHGEIMKGAFCKMKQMKHASANPPDSAHEEIEECFISIDEGGLPSGTVTNVFHLDYKFVESKVSDITLIIPCWIFFLTQFKDPSQVYFNIPDKPPEYHS